jgi:hypothetical protein
MNTRTLRTALAAFVFTCGALALPDIASAANGDGSLAGHVSSGNGSSVAGATITVVNPETGFTRSVQSDSDGNYRFPFLPVGTYKLHAAQGDDGSTDLAKVVISLGSATTANLELGAGQLETVNVIGSRIVRGVDVSSVESATNITREELVRLPVDRNVTSVALLAPGLNKGDSNLGGISFGGSSVAENSFYINGLNVTDFYNRNGFSEVPYAFYKEFQVKTGGYSVEFGRTTGGVINAVTRSGTNTFEFGTEVAWQPRSLQSNGRIHPIYVNRFDDIDLTTADVYASGPIIRDKLFFFALYEFRDYNKRNTNDQADIFNDGKSDSGFWGAKVDWQINDRNQLELLAFSDKDDIDRKVYGFDLAAAQRLDYQNTEFEKNGGRNWAATYTAYLTEGLSAKALYGKNQRKASAVSLNDLDCNRVVYEHVSDEDPDETEVDEVGCTSVSNVSARTDDRKAARLDFEWRLADHQLRFGLDHEKNVSDYLLHYPGPDHLRYDITPTTPGTQLANDGIVPPGVFSYVRSRANQVDGTFATIDSAYYLEDNWQITPRLVLNAGVRVEAFNNKNSDGDTYIKQDNMVAPRLGFSFDVKGDSRSKIFGNAGRYFLPVANVINIKQAGGFLDRRTYYVFEGFEDFEYNGSTFQRPILGAQIGEVDDSQGDGTVGDLRGEVDKNMDPVYQDELILGYQSMLTDRWSWGVRGIYRRLHDAIDDMEITSNGVLCGGEPTYVGFVMANPGKNTTVFSDTDCDGENDAFVTIDTAKAGWALFDDDGNYVGERGWEKPSRDYRALELQIDRSWDDRWDFNGTYTLAFSRGNAEGPVNSDTNFDDSGRTENFDNPWVNYNGYGYLANDRRHQLKLRGSFGITPSWQIGATLTALSGRPINKFGLGNPFDSTSFQSFYVCVENCTAPVSQRTYELNKRASLGRTPWTYDLGLSLSYNHELGPAKFEAKLAVYNVLNMQRRIDTDEYGEDDIGVPNPFYGLGEGYQAPRFALFTVNVKF